MQGRVAASIAARVLNGEDIAAIDVVTTSPNTFTFDFNVMRRHGVEPGDLPEGSRIINQPMPFLDKYGAWIPWAVAFLVFQTAIIVVLVISNRRRRMAERRAISSENRFRDFARSTADWLWEMDRDLKYTYCDPRFHEASGVPYEQVLGFQRDAYAAPGPEIVGDDKWQAHLAQMARHEPFHGFEYRIDTPRLGVRDVTVSGNPFFDDDGSFAGYRGTATDITERNRTEAAHRDALALAERANRAKSEFLATMSHEFRTPLNAIMGFSDMLRNEVFGSLGMEQYKEYATDIHYSGLLMKNLIDDILYISAIEAGKRQINAEPVDVAALAADAARQIEPAAAERDLSFRVEIPNDLSPIVADQRSVLQIVLNLLSNAVKFTDPGGSVTFAVRQSGKETAMSVSDTGIGIDPDRLSRIAEPFSQAHDNPHITQKGSGLGLSIVTALAEAQDATFEIDSEPGIGTTAIVRFHSIG